MIFGDTRDVERPAEASLNAVFEEFGHQGR